MEGDPEGAVVGTKSGTLLSTKVDAELLVQGSVFEGQRGLGHQPGTHQGLQSRDECVHHGMTISQRGEWLDSKGYGLLADHGRTG